MNGQCENNNPVNVTIGQLADRIKAELPYTANEQQEALIASLARFCAGISEDASMYRGGPSADRAFVINGYAGTGKTSLISALVRALTRQKIKVVLMAPTGRAAKVFNSYSGFPASTIHRRIYRHSLRGEIPPLKDNRDNNTLYIVDEASMISSSPYSGSGQSDLLTDLLTYVFGGINNRLILMGDTAQLPPVGEAASPAMVTDNLRGMGLKVSSATLTQVARQGARSGILANAINIRRSMAEHPDKVPKPIVEPFEDVHAVIPQDMAEAIDSAYRTVGIDDSIIITRSNQRAADFNRAIRAEVLYYEEELVADEPLMIVKNNYYWTRVEKRRDIDLIANGDIMRVVRVLGTEVKYGFRFADVELVPQTPGEDDSDTPPLQAKIFLETLSGNQAALPQVRMRELYEALVTHEYQDCPDPLRALADNPYWNALQAKYAYCVTCHKAQGGQWSHVFVDITYINPETIGPELYRWMYTATTRARKDLSYLTDTPQEW